MKKFLLSLVTIAMIGLVSVSCSSSSRTTYRSYSEGTTLENQGVWKRCAVCDGKGSCKSCKGTGRISGDNCRSCKGTGKCPTCKGNGGYELAD